MTGQQYQDLVEKLTGTPLKGIELRDLQAVETIVSDDNRKLDCAQFNELLLLVNKDRVEPAFFERFFGKDKRIRDWPKCLEKFQVTAMLTFGNFIFAYRVLSRAKSKEEIEEHLKDHCCDHVDGDKALATRPKKLLDIETIPRTDTPLIGYLSTGIIAEALRAELLTACIGNLPAKGKRSDLEELIREVSKPDEAPSVIALLDKLEIRKTVPESARAYLKNVTPKLKQRKARLDDVQARGIKNQDVYLTWDEMDVYFATSMRKAWEYEDLYDFIKELMSSPHVSDLAIRFFDPTQSYTPSRIDKGIVESLMLKRAKCTVYSVQDTDTLSKDSELAATLAQGKPVIAYIPTIDVKKRKKELIKQDPISTFERLRFILYADEKFSDVVPQEDVKFVQGYDQLLKYRNAAPFSSIPDEKRAKEFRELQHTNLERLCQIIAESEKRIYDKRSDTLKTYHPLALQVNLRTTMAT